MIKFFRALAGSLSLLLLPAQAQTPFWQQPDYVEKAFIEVAFKREYRKGLFRLARWSDPIRYHIRITDGIQPLPVLTDTIHKHMQRLARITGHPITPVDNPLDANLQVVLTRQDDYARQIRQRIRDKSMANLLSQTSNCMANFRTNFRSEIIDAWVIIPADHAFRKGLYYACVVEELTQIMGMPNDSDWVTPSIANDNSAQEDLSPLDIRFLKLLYNPALKPGMTLEQARPILRQLIREQQ